MAEPAVKFKEDQVRSDLLIEQLEYLYRAPLIAKYFSRPYPNNFVFVLIPIGKSRDDYLLQLKHFHEPLNKADMRLHRACSIVVGQLCENRGQENHEALRRWKAHFDRGSNLLGVEYAISVIRGLSEAFDGEDSVLHKRLRSVDNRVLDNFIHIPPSIQSLVRLNFYVPHENAIDLIETWLREQAGDSPIWRYIERIEVAKQLTETTTPHFPTVMLYLDRTALRKRRVTALRMMVEHAAELSLRYVGGGVVAQSSEFAHRITINLTLTQGYRLYKRYLAALRLIDDVYDPLEAHAFLHARHPDCGAFLTR